MSRISGPVLGVVVLLAFPVPCHGADAAAEPTVSATAPVTLRDVTPERLALPYEDRFDEPAEGWVPFLNYWRLKPVQWYWDREAGRAGGCLRHEAGLGVPDPKRGAHDAAILLRGGEAWTDYVFEADAYARAGHFGLWVRADMRDEGKGNGRWVQGYYLVFNPRGGKCRLWRARQDGLVGFDREAPRKPERNHFSNPLLLAEAAVPSASHGRWLRLRLEARGPAIAASVDGERVVRVEDPLYPRGTVGFTTYKGQDVRFDNVRVLPLNPED